MQSKENILEHSHMWQETVWWTSLHFRNLKITNQGTEIVDMEAGKGGVSIILICKEAHDLINGYILYLQVTVAEDKLFLQNMLPTRLEWSPILSFYRYFKDTAMDIIFIIALFIPFQKKVPFLYTWKATSFKSTSLYNFTIYMSPKVPSRMEHSKHTM